MTRADEKVGPRDITPEGTNQNNHRQVAATSHSSNGGGENATVSFLRKLVKLDVPMWLAEATQPGEPDHACAEFHRPFGWQQNQPEALERVVAGFRSGTDLFPNTPAICANMGGAVVVVDVDPRNGGDIDKVRALLADLGVRIFAGMTTPSDGKHLYIAGHPDLPTVHSNAENNRLPGYPGVDIQSFGTNVFVPGTRRPKYGGRGYTIEFDDLDALINEGDPEGAERFAGWVADQTASHICGSSKGRERAEFVFDPAPQWDGTLPDERQQRYLDAVLTDEAKKVSQTEEGGRNDALNIAALKLGHYVAGAGLDQDKVIAQLELAAIECGLADDDGVESVHATIRSGLRAGIKTPRAVPQMTEEGDFFGDKGGLLAKQLAEAVMRGVRCGFNDTTKKFYVYDGGVWVLNADHIEAEIGNLLGNRYRKSHKGNVLDLIQFSDTTLRITGEPRPDHINTLNGMVDWKTGDLLPHSPDYLSTVRLPVEYDVEAKCPAFETFLTQLLLPDCYLPTEDSPQGFIWELIGYTMYSGNPLHIAILLRGIGRNGKGTLIRVLKALLGGNNTSAVGLHDLTENRFRTATLYGKLANLAGDLDSKWINNTSAFKAITGGDTVQAEEKYGAAFDFTPWALPIYSANKPFGSADSSEGWHARWVVVPFPNNFLHAEDRTLDAKLQTDAELRGIMLRGIRALPALMARGWLPEPDSVTEAKESFIVVSDAIRAWIDEQCILDPDGWTKRAELYLAYRNHATQVENKPLGAREFYNRLEQISSITKCKNNVWGFKGITLGAATGGPA